MVTLDLSNIMFALVYAFPAFPSAIVDETGQQQEFQWKPAGSSKEFRTVICNLIKTSDALEASRSSDATVDELAAVSNAHTLSARYRLGLYDPGVPITVRQMVESVCAVYNHLYTEVISTRDDLVGILRLHQFIPSSVRFKEDGNTDRSQSALLRFCAEHTVEWMQPFFARHVQFFIPPDRMAASFDVKNELWSTANTRQCPLVVAFS